MKKLSKREMAEEAERAKMVQLVRDQLSTGVLLKLDALVNRAEAIHAAAPPDYDEKGHIIDFWGPKVQTRASLAINMFRHYIFHREELLSSLLIQALEDHVPGLPEDPIEAYNVANAPAHPIRNYMIRNSCDLMDDVQKLSP